MSRIQSNTGEPLNIGHNAILYKESFLDRPQYKGCRPTYFLVIGPFIYRNSSLRRLMDRTIGIFNHYIQEISYFLEQDFYMIGNNNVVDDYYTTSANLGKTITKISNDVFIPGVINLTEYVKVDSYRDVTDFYQEIPFRFIDLDLTALTPELDKEYKESCVSLLEYIYDLRTILGLTFPEYLI